MYFWISKQLMAGQVRKSSTEGYVSQWYEALVLLQWRGHCCPRLIYKGFKGLKLFSPVNVTAPPATAMAHQSLNKSLENVVLMCTDDDRSNDTR